jgi:glycosyltransferase AglD
MVETQASVSIVVACYNEESILRQSLDTIIKVMNASKMRYEIILVDDKSSDGTLSACKEIIREHPDFQLLTHDRNRGRGKTVTDGIIAAKNDVVAFIDIDLETPAHYLPPLFQLILSGADVAIAERVYKIKPHSLHRWVLSKGYMYLAKIFCNTPRLDTESGCKAFNRKKILQILSQIKDERWFWDTEIVIRSYCEGLVIKQLPTLFIRRREIPSTVKLFRDSFRHFIKLIQFQHELKVKYTRKIPEKL